MREGWKKSTVGEMCALMTGGTPSSSERSYYEGGDINWVVSGDVHKKQIWDCEKKITKLGMENSNARMLPKDSVLIALNGIGKTRGGDVLFNRTNSSDLVGKTGLFSLDGDYCFASYLVRVNYDPSKMNSTFAAYLMNTSQFLDRVRAKAARSVNQANINATILRNEVIDFPESVTVQENLVTKFDALSAETERLEQSYAAKAEQLAQLKQSILQKAFSGELTSPPSQAIKEAAE